MLGEIPPPSPKLTLTVPGGATLTGMADLPRGMPEECTVAFNLMLQLGPILGSLECLIRLFAFIGKIVEVAKAATSTPPDPVAVVQKLAEAAPAAEDVAECVIAFTPPIGLCPPIKSALQLVVRFLSCLIDFLESIVKQRLEIDIQMGQAQGNPALMEVLQQAQANADALGAQALQSVGPAFDLLQTFGGLIAAVAGGALEVPSLDDLTQGELGEAIQPLKDFVQVLQTVIDALPC
jgi:hypothetical protein